MLLDFARFSARPRQAGWIHLRLLLSPSLPAHMFRFLFEEPLLLPPPTADFTQDEGEEDQDPPEPASTNFQKMKDHMEDMKRNSLNSNVIEPALSLGGGRRQKARVTQVPDAEKMISVNLWCLQCQCARRWIA